MLGELVPEYFSGQRNVIVGKRAAFLFGQHR